MLGCAASPPAQGPLCLPLGAGWPSAGVGPVNTHSSLEMGLPLVGKEYEFLKEVSEVV